MTDEEKAAELAPRSWRNWHRSRRARELRRDMTAVDKGLIVTDWWKTDDQDDAS